MVVHVHTNQYCAIVTCIIALATKFKKNKLVKYKTTKIFTVGSESYLWDKSLCLEAGSRAVAHSPLLSCWNPWISPPCWPWLCSGSRPGSPQLHPTTCLLPALLCLSPVLHFSTPKTLSLLPAPALSRLLSSSSSWQGPTPHCWLGSAFSPWFFFQSIFTIDCWGLANIKHAPTNPPFTEQVHLLFHIFQTPFRHNGKNASSEMRGTVQMEEDPALLGWRLPGQTEHRTKAW